MGLRAKTRPKKYKNSRYAIRNVSKKDFSKIITEFEKLPQGSYDKKRPKHEPTDRYFYPARHLAKCMMRSDPLNSENYPVRTEMTDIKQIPTSHICSFDESKLNEFLGKTVYHIFVLRTRTNQKASSQMNARRRKTHHNAFTKI